MGSFRTWSLAVIAGIFVMVVAHQRSIADAGMPGSAQAPAAAQVPVTSAPAAARVTGLPDFSGLVAENDFDGLSFLHNMEIRENVTARIDDKARAGSLDRDRVHKEIVFGGFGEDVGDSGRGLTVDTDVENFFFGECGVAGGDIF